MNSLIYILKRKTNKKTLVSLFCRKPKHKVNKNVMLNDEITIQCHCIHRNSYTNVLTIWRITSQYSSMVLLPFLYSHILDFLILSSISLYFVQPQLNITCFLQLILIFLTKIQSEGWDLSTDAFHLWWNPEISFGIG